MTDRIYLEFNRAGVIESDSGYTGKTFYFLGGSNQEGTHASGDFQWSRAINKNIISEKIPVSSYEGGGIGIDIGMSEDTFELKYVTYSYEDFRYLGALCKTNNDLKCGDLHLEVQGHSDVFAVALKNVQFNMAKGRGFACEIKLSLMVVDPDLSATASLIS